MKNMRKIKSFSLILSALFAVNVIFLIPVVFAVSHQIPAESGGFGGGTPVDPENPLEPGEFEEFKFYFEGSGAGVYVVAVRIHSELGDSNSENNVREEEIEVMLIL